jgi:hypothetical protein
MDNPGKLATKTQDEDKQKKNTTQYKTNVGGFMSYLCYLFVYVCPTHIFLTKCDFFLFFLLFFCIVLSNEKIIM